MSKPICQIASISFVTETFPKFLKTQALYQHTKNKNDHTSAATIGLRSLSLFSNISKIIEKLIDIRFLDSNNTLYDRLFGF